jgi:uncharacterized protein
MSEREQAVRPENAVAHFDISGPDEEGLHRFYSDLLGWKVSPKGPGYALVQTPGGLGGAIVGAEEPGVSLGVVVQDLEQAVRHATGLGGTVVMPPTDNGWVVKAQVSDPAGNRVSLIAA